MVVTLIIAMIMIMVIIMALILKRLYVCQAKTYTEQANKQKEEALITSPPIYLFPLLKKRRKEEKGVQRSGGKEKTSEYLSCAQKITRFYRYEGKLVS